MLLTMTRLRTALGATLGLVLVAGALLVWRAGSWIRASCTCAPVRSASAAGWAALSRTERARSWAPA